VHYRCRGLQSLTSRNWEVYRVQMYFSQRVTKSQLMSGLSRGHVSPTRGEIRREKPASACVRETTGLHEFLGHLHLSGIVIAPHHHQPPTVFLCHPPPTHRHFTPASTPTQHKSVWSQWLLLHVKSMVLGGISARQTPVVKSNFAHRSGGTLWRVGGAIVAPSFLGGYRFPFLFKPKGGQEKLCEGSASDLSIAVDKEDITWGKNTSQGSVYKHNQHSKALWDVFPDIQRLIVAVIFIIHGRHPVQTIAYLVF